MDTLSGPDESDVVNEFLRVYLGDIRAGCPRSLADYQSEYPGFEASIEREFLHVRSDGATADGADRSVPPGLEQIGPYVLKSSLGRGGQGHVFLAEDSRSGGRVALKVLTRLSALSEIARLRFLREAELASKLDDPGICTVYEAGEADGFSYIAMQYLDGTTLSSRLSKRRSEQPAGLRAEEIGQVVGQIEQVARAVHQAHEAGILHRDLKPANVLITREGDPVILDFGTARGTDSTTLTFSGDVFGTPVYMAPEQVRGDLRLQDRRTDVYALGVTLYECLTLTPPFQSESRDALYQKILHKLPPDPRRLNPRISQDLAVVLEKAMEKDRNRRYVTAAELADDLRRVRERRAIRARPVTPAERFVRWTRREPAQAGLLAASVATVGLAATLLFNWNGIQAAREQARVEDQRDMIDEGFAELQSGSPSKAMRLFDEAMGMGRNPEAIAGSVLSRFAVLDYENALAVLDLDPMALELYPDLEWIRAYVFWILGRDEAALEIHRRLETKSGPLGPFVESLRTRRGLAQDEESYSRAAEFFVEVIISSAPARQLFHFDQDDLATPHEPSASATRGMPRVIFEIQAEEGVDSFGHIVRNAGDVDRDGRDDFLVTGNQLEGSGRRNFVRLYSGRAFEVMKTYRLDQLDTSYSVVDDAGDLDGDGHPDQIVGVYGYKNAKGEAVGTVRLLSGGLGEELWRIDGDQPDSEFGAWVAGLGDLDQDGIPEFAVGAPAHDHDGRDSGMIRIYSFPERRLLLTLYGTPGSYQGWIDSAGDVDGDGVEDIIVGAPKDDPKGIDSGSAAVYSLWDPLRSETRPTPLKLHEFNGVAFGSRCGMRVGSAGDLDRDGHAEVMVSDYWASPGGYRSGQIRVFAGIDGALLYDFPGDTPLAKFGISLGSAGDFDGDDCPDIVAGGWWASRGGEYSGQVKVFSGRDGRELLSADGDRPLRGLGTSVAAAGDVDGDGFADVIVGAYCHNPYESLQFIDREVLQLAGAVYVFAGGPP